MGVRFEDARRGPRAPRPASPRVVPGATSLRSRVRNRLRAVLDRGRLFRRPAPVELSPLAHALDVLAHL